MACWDGFGNLNDGRPIWVGNFEHSGFVDRDILFYYPGDHNWWLGTFSSSGDLSWRLVGNTVAFGDLADGRPIWVADFTGTGREGVLFYYPGDRNWWLGTITPGGSLTWRLVGNTVGFGQVWDGRPFWIGDFTGTGRRSVLFYYPGDHNWWLGSISGNQLTWQLVGNAAGFGNVADGRPFWLGYFSNLSRAELLFYYPGDHNWWLGSFSPGGANLTWTLAGNTAGFGNVADGRPFWVDDFDADFRSNLLFHYPGDHNWWLGTISPAGALNWRLVGNTAGFGNIWPNGRFWAGYFSGVFRPDLLFYQPADGNWWLGTLSGSKMTWQFVGNTSGFGNISGLPFWQGFFKGHGGTDVLFYYNGDGNWWLGSRGAGSLAWKLAGNTGRKLRGRVRLHFKLLAKPAISVDQHFQTLRDYFANAADILLERGTTTDLTAPNPALDDLRDLDVADCVDWWLLFPNVTAEQERLFMNRDGAGVTDVVVYFVRTITATGESPESDTIGCATHPAGRPGCVVEASVNSFVVAHEIAHVLNLGHVDDTDRLMHPVSSDWTNLPPDVTAGEATWMAGSAYAKC